MPAQLPQPPSGVAIRDVDPTGPDVAPWRATANAVFKDAVPATQEALDWRRPDYLGQRLTAAWDGDTVVGTFRSWDAGLTVPGGATVRADAVSTVTVAPTHRRRGILTAMMHADLEAAAGRGVPVAVLVASEATIYERYGFAPATLTATWTVDRRSARVRPDAPTGGTTSLVGAQEFSRVAPQVYAAARRPGSLDVTQRWWDALTGVDPVPGRPLVAAVHAVHRRPDGTADGLLRYRPEDRWEDRTCRTVVHVDVLVAAGPAAYADLARVVLGLDLVATVRLEERALDEVLPHLLVDPRAARVTSVCDFLWARLLDVPAAIEARSYAGPVDVTIEVADPAGWASGRWRIAAGGDGRATCTPAGAGDRSDVRMPVQVLSSGWLGGGDLLAAAAAGRAEQLTPGALPRLAQALRTPRSPWNWIWF